MQKWNTLIYVGLNAVLNLEARLQYVYIPEKGNNNDNYRLSNRKNPSRQNSFTILKAFCLFSPQHDDPYTKYLFSSASFGHHQNLFTSKLFSSVPCLSSSALTLKIQSKKQSANRYGEKQKSPHNSHSTRSSSTVSV